MWPGNSKHDISDLVGTLIGDLLANEIIYASPNRGQQLKSVKHACVLRSLNAINDLIKESASTSRQ